MNEPYDYYPHPDYYGPMRQPNGDDWSPFGFMGQFLGGPGFGLFPGQQPGFPPGQQPGFPPGQQPGFPPGRPPSGGPTGGPPQSPPPSFTPQSQQIGVQAVDPGAIRGCLYRYTYIWLDNRQQFWFYPTFVGRRSVSGYRWTGFFWVYYGVDLRRINSFQCF